MKANESVKVVKHNIAKFNLKFIVIRDAERIQNISWKYNTHLIFLDGDILQELPTKFTKWLNNVFHTK